MSEARVAAWRDIDALAVLVGTYCWTEKRIFEVAGAWATGAGDSADDCLEPALRVWCAGVSRRHGLLAARWAERLPARAGVDRAALVRPPDGQIAAALAGLDLPAGSRSAVAVLVDSVLPGLQAVYDAHRRLPNPVSEAPVLEVLGDAWRLLAGEISAGRALLKEPATS